MLSFATYTARFKFSTYWINLILNNFKHTAIGNHCAFGNIAGNFITGTLREVWSILMMEVT